MSQYVDYITGQSHWIFHICPFVLRAQIQSCPGTDFLGILVIGPSRGIVHQSCVQRERIRYIVCHCQCTDPFGRAAIAVSIIGAADVFDIHERHATEQMKFFCDISIYRKAGTFALLFSIVVINIGDRVCIWNLLIDMEIGKGTA